MKNNKPVAQLIGKDGNVFNLIGIVRRALVDNGMEKEAKEMVERAYNSQSYEEL